MQNQNFEKNEFKAQHLKKRILLKKISQNFAQMAVTSQITRKLNNKTMQ